MSKKQTKKQTERIESQVKKQLAQLGYQGDSANNQGRGYRVVTMTRLNQLMAEGKDFKKETITFDNPIYYLTPIERERIFRLCSPVFGVITSRMNRMSAIDFTITMDKKNEDREYEKLKEYKQLFDEYDDLADLEHLIVRARAYQMIKSKLPEVRKDLVNFDSAVIRWKKRIGFQKTDKSDEIKDYLLKPNAGQNWVDFMKEWVKDHHLHGAAAVYKKITDGIIQSLFVLPGGSVMPFRSEFVEDRAVFIQFADGKIPQLFRPEEMSYVKYVPTSFQSGGYVPIEALINKITETLLFDKLMAEQADGTRYPEKMVIINDASPFGDMDKDLIVPLDKGEQKRIEEKIKTKIEGGVMTFSGNSATVVDLSRENTMSMQTERQKDIRDETALVFNMSIQEVNLSGDKKFSSNDSSEQMSEMDQGKGIAPIKKQFEIMMNMDILPFMVGGGFSFEFDNSRNEFEEYNLITKKMQSGIHSIDELRIEKNLMPFNTDSTKVPAGTAEKPDGTEINPLNMRQL